jgi:hypothetical protein
MSIVSNQNKGQTLMNCEDAHSNQGKVSMHSVGPEL